MSYKTSFMDGQKYAASDLNELLSHFITTGIADPFRDGVPYNVTRINDMSASLAERGVVYDDDTSLKVVRIDDSYYIKPGTAFFANGSTLTVVSDESVLPAVYENNYIYLVSDTAQNSNYIEVSVTPPDEADENIIYLADISADGVITDHRFYATGKLTGCQNNFNTLKKKVITHTINRNGVSDSSDPETTISEDLGTDRLSFVMVSGHNVLSFWDIDANIKQYYAWHNSNYSGTGANLLVYYQDGASLWEMVSLTNIQSAGGTVWDFVYYNSTSYSSRQTDITYTLYYI